MQHPEVESLDRDGILKLQREGLAGLGARLARCDTWKAHFAQAGMKPEDLASEDGLANAPFMDKSLLRDLYPFPFLTVPMESVERFVATSGTTGLPVTFGMTKNDYNTLLPYQMARLLSAAGVKPGFRAYQGYGYGLWIGGPALDAGFSAVGCTNFPIGPGRGELAARWLRDHAYDVASMSPLWLMTLVQAAKNQGIDPRTDWTLKVAILGGQSVSAEFRAQLEAEMPAGFMSHNIYGTTEAGGPILAISTPHTHADDELQLLNEDTVIVEILDPKTMKPVSEGEVGEIVITTLRKEASPVVRWRTRDLVRLSPRPYDCPSGRRGMRKIGRIIGRTDDMIKFKGVIVFPSQIEDVIAGIPGLAKEAWQIYVDKEATTIGKMTVAVEAVTASQRPGEDAAADVRREIKARLGINVNVECHAEGVLPRYEAKATRVLHRPEATH
ncbi:phenylacetate--CoA ligase family protein [Xanthobacter flavus]|uniref:phenylacetate--CoA ligase family protein n=1 Tax=Xanthobacter flavus TaxID=281 RepID=UPI001AEA256C|nr:AMP-binding protein [Xanthobacter flavus]MBP2148754.1 phenylacetate-coenzyme A ligase PaaK-like adenylate-forming protein [Xanthobacter flavus]